MRGSFFRPFAVAVCLLLLGVPASRSQMEPLQASRGGETLCLVPAGGAALIDFPGETELKLALPHQAEVSAFSALGEGWITAGSFTAADDRRRLFLLRGNEAKALPLPEPPGQTGDERRSPVLLVDKGRLVGLAWLEGDSHRTLTVRAAAWNGRRWQPPVAVSHPGLGSQLALSGTVLGDGTWLLAWSAYDGKDDEIVWSRRSAGGAWSPVRSIATDNAVPDITPAVTAAGDGALISWSRYDGEQFRLMLARFNGKAWRDEKPVGPAGSLYPSWSGTTLLYLEAEPRAWSVLDVSAAGRVRAKASVPSRLDRPVVAVDASGGVTLRWPSLAQEAAARLEKVP